MSRDLFYEQILAGLNGLGPSDRDLFQDCMTDLLRDTFPGLVPVRGGKDSGMDGAIADGKGEPYPLVATTAKDVERNLKRSLSSYLKRKRPRREVVLATSQALTPERQHKLKDLAQGKGFTLVGLIEQSGVADRLRENGYWRERLLGLTGEPSTLSVVPASRRPLLDVEPIGRDGDIEWLKTTSEDRVLSGAPGSGKTFLLYHLTRQGWGTFVVNPEGPVAKDLLNQTPEVVIFDDAHVRPEFLVKLRHLREEMKLSFSIVATTWEWEKDKVIDALGVGEGQVHRLELLTRNEIVEVYRGLGVQESSDTMRYLVDQAANKPGLAATIGTLWLQGEWQAVIKGEALSRTLLTFFQQHVGPESTDILAAFGLGGDQGMEVEAVREFLELNRLKFRQIASGLAAGGVLSEIDRDVWAVWPRPLRFALVRTVFFSSSAPRHDYEDLVKRAPNYDKAVSTITASKLLGANITEEELGKLVAKSNSAGVWRDFAHLSPETAKWALANYPGDFLDITVALLHTIPQLVIPRILERAEEFSRTREFRSERAMSALSSWVQEISAGPEEWIRRRETLARAVREFLFQGGEPGIGMYGISIALSPAVRGDSLDPGMGNTVITRSGLMPVETLRKVVPVWDNVKDVIQDVDAASWQHLSSLLWDWLHPEYVAKRTKISKEERLVTSTFVATALKDLVPLSEGSPGIQAGLNRLAAKLGIDLGLGQDNVFELLYPPQDPSLEARREAQAVRDEAVGRLAAEWAKESPQKVSERIALYEREAQRIGYNWTENMPNLCRALAESVHEPEEWLNPLLKENLRGHLVSPFLEQTVKLRRDGWASRLEECLDIDRLVWTAASLILTLSDPPPALLDRALVKVRDHAMLVEGLCLRREVPLPTLRWLLSVPSWEIVLAAAVGEWCADPQGEVREDVRPEWRAGILRAKTGEYDETQQTVGLQYWLGIILASDADLALDWLRSRLRDSDLPWHFLGDSPFFRATSALRIEQKKELLEELRPASILLSLIPALIGRDKELFRRLLETPSLADYHLEPLGGPQAPDWESFVCAALDVGYNPEIIAQAAIERPHSWTGSGLEYWERWDQDFVAFEGHSREDFREVVRIGRERVQEKIARARKSQRQFELYGVGRER
jgi:hypothetical protein